ncbi:MAG: carboxypeptidase-like regulatory domain-containing protein [Terriglobia bacterium]
MKYPFGYLEKFRPVRSWISRFSLIAALLCAPVRAQTSLSLRPGGPTAHVKGAVVDDRGNPIGGAFVGVVRTFPLQGVPGPRMFATTADAHGNFEFNFLPPASYKFCARSEGRVALDPCLWSSSPPAQNLAGGQHVTVTIPMQTGVWMRIRVNDPGKKAAAEEQKSGHPAFHIGVFALSGAFLELKRLTADPQGKSFRVAVPKGKSIPVMLSPGDLNIQDNSGKQITAGGGPQHTAVGQTDLQIEFNIE